MRIVIATHNEHKRQEYEEVLKPLGYEVLSAKDLGIKLVHEENGQTYKENALIKAQELAEHTEEMVIGDDSGIEINALGDHFPGIHSARYAESIGTYDEVHREVLSKLEGASDRGAAYHCLICLIEKGSREPIYFEGVCPGYILEEPKGKGGFGFDPIFHSIEGDYDFGLCTSEEKNSVSHRGKAVEGLIAYLKAR